jgi:protein gp37
MSGKSKIQWTGRTWNPVVGCSKCSKGCEHCYAMWQAFRCEAMGISQYQGLTIIQGKAPNWTGKFGWWNASWKSRCIGASPR